MILEVLGYVMYIDIAVRECIVPQLFNFLVLKCSIVREIIWSRTGSRLSFVFACSDWMKIDHALLLVIMIDSYGTVHCKYKLNSFNKNYGCIASIYYNYVFWMCHRRRLLSHQSWERTTPRCRLQSNWPMSCPLTPHSVSRCTTSSSEGRSPLPLKVRHLSRIIFSPKKN